MFQDKHFSSTKLVSNYEFFHHLGISTQDSHAIWSDLYAKFHYKKKQKQIVLPSMLSIKQLPLKESKPKNHISEIWICLSH